MTRPRSTRKSLLLALAGWLLSTLVVVAMWIYLDADWSLAVIPLMVVAGISAYTYVLARRGL